MSWLEKSSTLSLDDRKYHSTIVVFNSERRPHLPVSEQVPQRPVFYVIKVAGSQKCVYDETTSGVEGLFKSDTGVQCKLFRKVFRSNLINMFLVGT